MQIRLLRGGSGGSSGSGRRVNLCIGERGTRRVQLLRNRLGMFLFKETGFWGSFNSLGLWFRA